MRRDAVYFAGYLPPFRPIRLALSSPVYLQDGGAKLILNYVCVCRTIRREIYPV
jgi:hypothetical protein